jgi:hypothetical protein
MLVNLHNRILKSKPEPPPKALKSYMAPSSRCVTIGGNPDLDEMLAILKEKPKLVWHVAKRRVRRAKR